MQSYEFDDSFDEKMGGGQVMMVGSGKLNSFDVGNNF